MTTLTDLGAVNRNTAPSTTSRPASVPPRAGREHTSAGLPSLQPSGPRPQPTDNGCGAGRRSQRDDPPSGGERGGERPANSGSGEPRWLDTQGGLGTVTLGKDVAGVALTVAPAVVTP